MGTMIRADISKKNDYWISKHRYYELKHYCLQYTEWKQNYIFYVNLCSTGSVIFPRKDDVKETDGITERNARRCAYFSNKMEQLERIAKEAGEDLSSYLLKAVTEDYSFNYLKHSMNIPCSKETYYECYRKFFWLLNLERG